MESRVSLKYFLNGCRLAIKVLELDLLPSLASEMNHVE